MNGDGTIDVIEICTVMANLGYPKTQKEAEEIVKSFDTDGNGTIEFDEVALPPSLPPQTQGKPPLARACRGFFRMRAASARRHPPT